MRPVRRLLPRFALALVGAALAAAAAPAAVTNRYAGTTSKGGKMSFRISADGKKVVRFRFASRCPSDSSAGTLVPGSMRIRKDRSFSHRDDRFRITGRFGTMDARGTARNQTGDCDSGRLRWEATLVRR